MLNRNLQGSSMEKMLDALLDEAAAAADKKIGESLAEPEEDIEFSDEHMKKMKKLFKRERRKGFRKSFGKYSGRIAAAALAVVVISAGSIFGVEAWRVKFLNFVYELSQPNSDFNFSESGGASYSDDEVTLAYIPMGFELEENNSTSRKIFLHFSNADKYFQFTVNRIDSNSSIDTESGISEKIMVNGNEGIYTENANIKSVIWYNEDYVFCVLGNIEKNEVLKIAQNVKK